MDRHTLQPGAQGRHTAGRIAPTVCHNACTIANAGRGCAGTRDSRVQTDRILQATAPAPMRHCESLQFRWIGFSDTYFLSLCHATVPVMYEKKSNFYAN